MSKKITTVYVNKENYNSDTITVEDMQEILSSAIDKGATHISIESEHDSCEVDIKFFFDREETDEEQAARVAKEEREKQSSLKWKRREYERLKKELGES